MQAHGASDVFSISDDVLSDKLQFVEEVRPHLLSDVQSAPHARLVQIGSGNWGSVWLCRAKPEKDGARRTKLAVKLVHRTKATPTHASEEDKKAADAASKRVKTL
jgi:serine/threonine-protein kinase GIN4